MKIKLTSVYVDDQEKALRFYTEVLGFVKKADFSNGPFRWLTVTSPEEPEGTELQLLGAAADVACVVPDPRAAALDRTDRGDEPRDQGIGCRVFRIGDARGAQLVGQLHRADRLPADRGGDLVEHGEHDGVARRLEAVAHQPAEDAQRDRAADVGEQAGEQRAVAA